MIRKFLIIFISFYLFYSCSDSVPDVSNIKIDDKIVRMDEIIFEKDVEQIDKWLPEVSEEYSSFMSIYTSQVIIAGGLNSRQYIRKMKYFIVYTNTFEIDKAIKENFVNFNEIEEKVNNSLKFYKYYYPKGEIPKIYSFISGFNQSVIIGPDFIGVGLDKYLGKNSHFYDRMKTANYIRYKANKNFIPADLMRALAYYKYDYPDETVNLLNKIIYEGKIQYFVDKMLPYDNDTLKIAYKPEQIEWCKNNEENVWTWFVENRKLMSTDFMEIKKYCDEAPFTSDFSKESPGRIGVWIGWQIVRSYMEHNKDITLPELMAEDDFQKIMNMSKYNP